MSTKSAYPTLRPWFDHWNTPSAEQLLKEVKETHLTVLPTLREQLRQLPGVEERVVWMGDAWKWAFEYILPGHHVSGPESPDAFAYLVPDPEIPLLVMPIADAFIDFVPFRRLNRYVRDGIKSGKLAVDLIWITWSPGPGPELEHLLDILRRKHRFLLAPPSARQEAAAAEAEAALAAKPPAKKPEPAKAASVAKGKDPVKAPAKPAVAKQAAKPAAKPVAKPAAKKK